MPWINTIDPEDATGKLEEIYKKAMGERGKISNILKIHSLLPRTMKTHLDFYMSIMFNKSTLSREERELIAVVVSGANSCAYCVNHHGEALAHYWGDRGKVTKAAEDFRSLKLPKRTMVMLDYAEKLTKTPGKITEEDVSKLRDQGLSDEDILNLGLIIGYFNFVNRVVLGLGVEFSPDEVAGYKY